MRLSLALFCVLAAPACLYACDTSDHSYSFDLLVMQWPPAFNKNLNYLTLHGLWPSRAQSDNYPCDCTNEQFDLSKVSDLEDRLNQYWPSLFGKDSQSFWAHEWTKHGTCSHDIPQLDGEYNYFKTALDLRDAYDFSQALIQKGITPGGSYDPNTMVQAGRSETGAEMVLGCDNNNHIQTMSLCVDKTLQPMDCPRSIMGGSYADCKMDQQVYWAGPNSDALQEATVAVANA